MSSRHQTIERTERDEGDGRITRLFLAGAQVPERRCRSFDFDYCMVSLEPSP